MTPSTQSLLSLRSEREKSKSKAHTLALLRTLLIHSVG